MKSYTYVRTDCGCLYKTRSAKVLAYFTETSQNKDRRVLSHRCKHVPHCCFTVSKRVPPNAHEAILVTWKNFKQIVPYYYYIWYNWDHLLTSEQFHHVATAIRFLANVPPPQVGDKVVLDAYDHYRQFHARSFTVEWVANRVPGENRFRKLMALFDQRPWASKDEPICHMRTSKFRNCTRWFQQSKKAA